MKQSVLGKSLRSRWLQRYFDSWLQQRIPRNRMFRLDLNNVFIFPSRFGWLFTALCLCLFLLGTNYQNNLILLLSFFLLSLFLVSLMVTYFNFAGLEIQQGKVGNSFAGDSACLPLWITAEKEQKKFGRLHLSLYGEPVQTSVDLDGLNNPVEVEIPTPARGRFRPPRITLCSYYPLGLFRCWTHLSFDCELIVYPTPLPCPLSVENRKSPGESEGQLAQEDGYDNFDSLTEYRLGQPLYHVAWKQVAKGQGMVSKKFSSNSQRAVWLSLGHGAKAELEKRLSQLCFMVLELSAIGQTFGLDLGSVIIEPDSGNAHQQACLTALAVFESDHAQA
ncbi:DUF58 domain-containing protein [Aliiglaciecola sp. CAU 1673]|uniref:DUF58 domain-containing protein n=1 Tax=Aliiglaciecola sp. CAU 1673 TaxID=3032595 RepID=UPI0023DCA22B|nr:DUF58 domain-containing protein [Aliiglaciecola sp. CAU 1673]MDF2179404.1 DUF58 domain-containing protein [Aliiglaciecola sp. CAU 1673]